MFHSMQLTILENLKEKLLENSNRIRKTLTAEIHTLAQLFKASLASLAG